MFTSVVYLYRQWLTRLNLRWWCNWGITNTTEWMWMKFSRDFIYVSISFLCLIRKTDHVIWNSGSLLCSELIRYRFFWLVSFEYSAAEKILPFLTTKMFGMSTYEIWVGYLILHFTLDLSLYCSNETFRILKVRCSRDKKSYIYWLLQNNIPFILTASVLILTFG